MLADAKRSKAESDARLSGGGRWTVRLMLKAARLAARDAPILPYDGEPEDGRTLDRVAAEAVQEVLWQLVLEAESKS